MKKIFKVITIFLLTVPISALAYDTTTHAAMTAEALTQSLITATPNTSPIFKKLGLFDRDYALGSYYMDIGSLVKRNTTPFERDIMRDVTNANSANLIVPTAESIPGWIVRGAIREDDNTKETLPGTLEGDEPGGVFDRVYGHFYDPVYDRGLTTQVLTLGPRSPDWATVKGVGLSGLGFGERQNYYNLPAAREAMWRALTLKAQEADGTLTDAVEPTNWTYTTKAELRNAYWATMFRAVGDMVHLLQDAGQPQHTRNAFNAPMPQTPRQCS